MNDLIAKTENALTPPPSNPWADAGASATGKILKFVDGVYKVGETVVEPGTKFVAQLHLIEQGWVRFENGEFADKISGKLAEGFKTPKREELSHVDESEWEEEGKDPWQPQWYLPLISESNELFLFITGSKGGDGAIRELCATYGRTDRACLPIVALKSDSYLSKRFHKRIHFPVFSIAGWNNPPPIEKEMDDEIPF